MRSWVGLAVVFVLGCGLGLSAPILASRYLDPYLPNILKNTVHPLEGSVNHKQRQDDRLLITITTLEGTILATFREHVQEIDLLIEEQDKVTLDVRQYEPFVTDPPVIRVTKYQEKPSSSTTGTPTPFPSEAGPETTSTLDPPPAIP